MQAAAFIFFLQWISPVASSSSCDGVKAQEALTEMATLTDATQTCKLITQKLHDAGCCACTSVVNGQQQSMSAILSSFCQPPLGNAADNACADSAGQATGECGGHTHGTTSGTSGTGGSSGTSGTSGGCDSGQLSADLQTCSTAFTQSMMAVITNPNADLCPGWKDFVCCIKGKYDACGVSGIETYLNTMSTSMSAAYPSLSSCSNDLSQCPGSSTGSSTGGSTTPTYVDTVLTAALEMADPTAFNMADYITAVKASSSSDEVTAVLKAWEIVVKYAVPDGTTEASLKSAIATTMSVLESAITIVMGSGRRLSPERRLATNADVTITATDAANAKALKTSAASTESKTALGEAVGGSISVVEAPKAVAKIETTVKTEDSKASQLTTQLASAGAAAGGTITATVKTTGTSTTGGTDTTSSTVSSATAAVSIFVLLTNALL